MNPDSIFSLFDSESENPSETPTKEITNLSEHPYVLMGLFTKMILKGEAAIKNSVDFLKAINPDVDIDNVKELNTYMVFTNGFAHLQKLTLEDPKHQETLLQQANDEFILACNKSIQYFSDLEEYEKCAYIKNFIDFINFSKKKLPL